MTWLDGDAALAGFDLGAHAWFSPDGRAVQRLSRSAECEILFVCWEPGQVTSYHDHGGSESVVTVLSGVLVARSGEVERVVRAGEVLVTRRGGRHQMRNDGPGRATTLHVYSPPLRGGVSQPFRDHTDGTSAEQPANRPDALPQHGSTP